MIKLLNFCFIQKNNKISIEKLESKENEKNFNKIRNNIADLQTLNSEEMNQIKNLNSFQRNKLFELYNNCMNSLTNVLNNDNFNHDNFNHDVYYFNDKNK
jgi:hypothetical protein